MNNNDYCFFVHCSKLLDIHKDTIMESTNVSYFENMFSCLDKAKTCAPKTFRHKEFSHKEEMEEKIDL